MKLSKQQLKTSTRHYIKKCAGAVCTSKLHESARNSNTLFDFGKKCTLHISLSALQCVLGISKRST